MPDGSLPALDGGLAPAVLVAPAPFEPRLERLIVGPGLSVAEILLEACLAGVLNPQDLCRTEVDIDGVRLEDRSAGVLTSLRPRPGQIVNVTVQVYGGGKGGNKALQAVLQVAIMVAAFAVAGPAGSAAGGFFQAGTTAARIATIAGQVAASSAVTLAGGALISALAPSTKADGAAQTYSLESQTNQARQREMFPLCLSRRRWAFDLASSAYTTFSGDDMWITAIYALHFGPCTLTDLKIGETLVTAYPAGEIQQELFLAPGPRNSALYPTNIHQDSFQNTLDRVHGDYATATTVTDATTVELDFYWAGGLYYSKGDGRTVQSDTKLSVEISPYGQNAWQPAPGLAAGVDKSGNAYPAGTYYVVAASKTPVRRTLSITLPTKGEWDVRIHRDTRPIDDTNQDTVTWTAIRMPRPGRPVLDETLSILVLKVKAAQDLSGSLGVISGVVTPIVPVPGADSSWSTTAPSDNAAALTRWLLTGPAAAKPLDATEIDASCAEQYALIEANGWQGGELLTDGTQQDALNKLAAAGRMLIYWSGSKLVFVPDWTKDAPRQLFAGRNAQGYRRKRMYPDPLHGLWVEFTNAGEDWKPDGLYVYADGYDASNATLIEKLSLGFACLPQRAHKEGRVFIARRKLQIWTHEFTAGADAVVSSYGDRVRARRTSSLYEQSDARVSHRRWSAGAGSAATGVRLDAAVRMVAGQSYAIDIRRPNGLVVGIPVVTAPGVTRDLSFATPLPAAQTPGKGDLIAFGKVGQVLEDLEIVDIAPQADGTVQITAANYVGDALVAAETGPIPALTTFLSTRVAAPTPRILTALGSPDGVFVGFDVDPQRTATLRGFVARWRVSPAAGGVSSWNTLALLAPNARSFTTPAIPAAQHQAGDADGEVHVDIELWSVLATGEASPAATANGVLIIQGVLAVSNFAASGAVRTAPDGSSYPVLHVSADPVLSGAVSELVVEQQPAGANPAAWVSAGHALPAANPVGDLTAVAGGKVYAVRGRWRDADGWVGGWTIVLAVAIPQNGLVSAGTVKVGTMPAQGLVDAVTAAQAAVTLLQTAVSSASSDAHTALTGLQAEVTRAQGAEGTLTSNYGTLSQTVSGNTTAINTEVLSRTGADSALGARIDTLTTTVNGNTTSITSEVAARSTADTALGGRIDTLTTTVGGNTTAISTEQLARSTADGALGSRIDSLTTTVGLVSGAVTTEQLARASADTALGSRVDTVSARVVTNPNLTPNGGFENGFQGWRSPGFNWSLQGSGSGDGYWGNYAQIGIPAGQTVNLTSAPFKVMAGRQYTSAADLGLVGSPGPNDIIYTDLFVWPVLADAQSLNYAAAGTQDGPNGGYGGGFHDFSDSDANRPLTAQSFTPSADGWAVQRVIAYAQGAGTVARARLLKTETGPNWTPYTGEATAQQTAASVTVTQQALAAPGFAAAAYGVSLTADAGGRPMATGFKLVAADGSTGAVSAFLISAEDFEVVGSDGSSMKFAAYGGGYLSVTNLAVQNANIVNLAIGTSKLAYGSAQQLGFAENRNVPAKDGNGTITNAVNVGILAIGGPVDITITVSGYIRNAGSADVTITLRLYVYGGGYRDYPITIPAAYIQTISAGTGNTGQPGSVTIYSLAVGPWTFTTQDNPPASGQYYQVDILGIPQNNVKINYASINIKAAR